MHIFHPGCKINLGLRITGQRESGYHELDTFFIPLSKPYDTLQLWTVGQGFSLQCDSPQIDLQNNTLTKAYQLFAQSVPTVSGVQAKLIKGIKSGAGLGGGSSDAATLLLWLNSQVSSPLSPAHLADLALQVGADVPFFLHNQPVRATGLGEVFTSGNLLEELNLNGAGLLLLCPEISISTPEAFKFYDEQKKCLTKFRPNDISLSSSWVINDLEASVFTLRPQLGLLKTQLLQHGARIAVMSGSGSSLLGIFKDLNTAENLLAFFSQGITAYAISL